MGAITADGLRLVIGFGIGGLAIMAAIVVLILLLVRDSEEDPEATYSRLDQMDGLGGDDHGPGRGTV